MRLRLNRTICLLIMLAGPASADAHFVDSSDHLAGVKTCLHAVKNPDWVRNVFTVPSNKQNFEISLSKPLSLRAVYFSSKTRDEISVNTCSGGGAAIGLYPSLQDLLSKRILDGIQMAADEAGLIKINLKSPGLHFADCHNYPNARLALSITRSANGALRYLAVQSPAVSMVCAQSYGMQ